MIFNYCICILLLIPLVKPDGISNVIPIADLLLFNSYFVLSVLTVSLFAFFLKLLKKSTDNTIFYFFLIFIFWLIVCTVYNSGPINKLFTTWYKSVGIFCIFMIYKKKLYIPMRVIEILLELYSVINVICMIRWPNGMYTMEGTGYTECWFLGYKSSFQYYFFVLILIAIIFYYYRNEIMNLLFIMILIHIQTIMCWNAMFLVSLIVIDVYLVFKFINTSIIFNVKCLSSLIVGLNISFIFFFSYLYDISWINYIFNNVLHKNWTLFTRFSIWSKGIQYIQKSFILGYGFTTGNEMINWFGISQVHLHNQFLMILLQGGIIGIVLFFAFISLTLKKINKYHDLLVSKATLIILFSLFLSVIVEIFTTSLSCLIWPIFIIGYYAKDIDQQLLLIKRCKRISRRKFKIR